ncbi:putative bifunctional diguanylate cyclase/phosphodiesterase [Marinomonas algicola]|uniref:putative bifunctional diguanylate cyclase/phosphodiesterase n=1 Tax=Marinomonas algicola TaxID=2773454 RepID=UPI00174A849C|nr:EAL domain-containing protein [Marinomonas algicola]
MNWVLLPIISLVFFVVSTIAIMQVVNERKQEIMFHTKQSLTLIHNNTMLQKKILEDLIRQTLNSPEVIAEANKANEFLHDLALEDVLFRYFKRSKKILPSLNSIQILDYKGDVLFSIDESDPFDEKRLMPIPKKNQLWLNDYNNQNPAHFFNELNDNQSIQGFIQPFSQNLFTDLNLHRNDNDLTLFYAIITIKNNINQNIKEHIRQSLGSDYEMKFSIIDRRKPPKESDFFTEIHFENSVLVNSLYTLSLKPDLASFNNEIRKVYYSIYGLALVVSFITYIILRSLFLKNLISPLLKLSKEIRNAKYDINKVKISHIDKNDEISELNNSYLNLLHNDPLTGLVNRSRFMAELEHAIELARANKKMLSVIYIDLDNFKQVNDQYGHHTGDAVLIEFANQLSNIEGVNNSQSQSKNTASRLSGDEFILCISNTEDVIQIIQDINALFKHGFLVKNIRHNIYASIGVATYPTDSDDAKTIISCADAAMYTAKENGKNQYCVFSASIEEKSQHRQYIERTLSNSLHNNLLHLVYMPIYNSKTNIIEGVEVLLRCKELTKSSIGPNEFIPIAESSGLIRNIDLWVLENAFIQYRRLKDKYNFSGYFSINISGVELSNNDFSNGLTFLLEKYKIPPNKIELEITETSLISVDNKSLELFKKIKSLGVNISLDDFGTGYSSFNQLSSFPVDTLKIDKSFIDTLEHINVNEYSLMNVILSIAKLYNLKVIAEGVETEKQLTHLTRFGCYHIQGYYFSQPIIFDELTLIINKPFTKT